MLVLGGAEKSPPLAAFGVGPQHLPPGLQVPAAAPLQRRPENFAPQPLPAELETPSTPYFAHVVSAMVPSPMGLQESPLSPTASALLLPGQAPRVISAAPIRPKSQGPGPGPTVAGPFSKALSQGAPGPVASWPTSSRTIAVPARTSPAGQEEGRSTLPKHFGPMEAPAFGTSTTQLQFLAPSDATGRREAAGGILQLDNTLKSAAPTPLPSGFEAAAPLAQTHMPPVVGSVLQGQWAPTLLHAANEIPQIVQAPATLAAPGPVVLQRLEPPPDKTLDLHGTEAPEPMDAIAVGPEVSSPAGHALPASMAPPHGAGLQGTSDQPLQSLQDVHSGLAVAAPEGQLPL